MSGRQHRVRLRVSGPWVAAHCRCGWSAAVSSIKAAGHAADAHCYDMAPDRPTVHGGDEGGPYWEPER